MSGHSKWSTIKHKKAAIDAKRGKIFSIISKQLTVAVKEGGSGDPTQNPRLRLAMEKAREANMPHTNIDKAIEKGLGREGGAEIETIIYEGYGAGGVGLMVKTLTDNRNRTGSEVKTLFDRNGGSLAGPGAAAYLFERDGDGYRVKVPLVIGEEDKRTVLGLVDALEEQEDVEGVWTNMT